MKIRCAACGATSSLDAAVAHDDAAQALNTALGMTPIGRLLVQYLGLFRPAKNSLSFDRVNTLLNELLPVIQSGQLDRAGRTWPAPLSYWQAALEQVLAARPRLTLPMKSHGYLYEIVAGMSNKTEATAEAKTEEARRHQTETDRRHQQAAAEAKTEINRAEQLARLQEVRSLAGLGTCKSTTGDNA